ncbi:hypothetical protein BT96DRAFT_841806, partial [Gymnopus androsaceus JB14]
ISSPWTIQPFNKPKIASVNQATQWQMQEFNMYLLSECIQVEHAFGKLKGCFPSLKEMGCHKKVQEMYKVIKALLILHNIDFPKHILDFDPMDDAMPVDIAAGDIQFELVDINQEANIPLYEMDQWIKEEG